MKVDRYCFWAVVDSFLMFTVWVVQNCKVLMENNFQACCLFCFYFDLLKFFKSFHINFYSLITAFFFELCVSCIFEFKGLFVEIDVLLAFRHINMRTNHLLFDLAQRLYSWKSSPKEVISEKNLNILIKLGVIILHWVR